METNKRVLEGTVVSVKNDKTAVVKVEGVKMHPIYRKRIRVSKKYHVHDEKNECAIGDLVAIIESRTYSKLKHFELKEILKKVE